MAGENTRLLDCSISGGGFGLGNISGTEGAVHDDLEGKRDEEGESFDNGRNEESDAGSLPSCPDFTVWDASPSSISLGDVCNGLLKELNRVLRRFSSARRFPELDCGEGSGIPDISGSPVEGCFFASCLQM